MTPQETERIAQEALAISAALLARMKTGKPLPPERLDEYSGRVLRLYEQLYGHAGKGGQDG